MKRLILLSAFLSFSLLASSQQKLEVVTGEKNMSKGQQMAVSVLIPDAKPKDVESIWKKYVNNRSFGERVSKLATQVGNIFKSDKNKIKQDKLKVEKKGDELYVHSIEQSLIASHSIAVYARVAELAEGCQFNAFFQYTDSVFINESNTDELQIQNMKSYIRDFGIIAYRDAVDDQIKAAKKEVSKQENILKHIESNSKKKEKSISRLEVDIQESESGITEVENDINHLDEKITAKKEAFSLMTKSSPEYDAAKTELKDLSKEKSKNFSKIKGLKGKIKSKKMDIKSLKNKIAANELEITRQLTVIDEKNQIVEKLKQKKEEIE